MTTELQCYDYVNQPFEIVRRALVADPQHLFTCAAGGTSMLHITLGSLDLGSEIEIEVGSIVEKRAVAERPATSLSLSWRGRHRPGLAPVMTATLTVYPLTPTETQVELSGTYTPPLGRIGAAIDLIALRKLAIESVERFVREVAVYLRRTLSATQATA